MQKTIKIISIIILVLLINELYVLNNTYIELLTWTLIGPIPTELTLPQLIDHTNNTILNDVDLQQVISPINDPNISNNK